MKIAMDCENLEVAFKATRIIYRNEHRKCYKGLVL